MDIDLSRLERVPAKIEDVPLYLSESIPELVSVIRELGDIQRELNVEPEKVYEGMLRYADGTNWNPGSGAGLYRYTGSAWLLIMGDGGATKFPILIESQVVSSAVATLDFTTGIDSTYDMYELVMEGMVPATDGAALWIRMQEGGSFKSGATDYTYVRIVGTAASVAPSGATAAQIVLEGVGNATGEHLNGTLRFGRPSLSTLYKIVWGQMVCFNSSGTFVNTPVSGAYNSNTNPVTGLRVLFSSGDIAAGRVSLYGYPH